MHQAVPAVLLLDLYGKLIWGERPISAYSCDHYPLAVATTIRVGNQFSHICQDLLALVYNRVAIPFHSKHYLQPCWQQHQEHDPNDIHVASNAWLTMRSIYEMTSAKYEGS